jgi:hypothetical protein
VGEKCEGQKGDQGYTEEVEEDECRILPAEIEAGDQEVVVAIKNAQQQDVGDNIPLRGRIGQIGM